MEQLAVVFRRPDAAPGDDEPGRVAQGKRLLPGAACRWCGGALQSKPRGKYQAALLECPRCDAPIGGDHTMLKFDSKALDAFLEDWWKNA
jgi:hypothetical protein